MKKSILVLVCAALLALSAFGIYAYRHRYVRSDADLLAILPGGDVTTLYVNVGALRDAGTLKLLAGTHVPHEREYESFVREINFDWSRDLDRLVAAADGNQLFFLLQGRFDWEKLRRYPANHGGVCTNHVCQVPASSPGRWASFHLIQPNVLALAFSPDTVAANVLQPAAHPREVTPPSEPVWLSLSDKLRKDSGDLPLPLRLFAISVQSANPVVLSAAAAAQGSGSAFRLQLSAACASETTAETIRNQLEIETKMLQLELKREGRSPSVADLTGLLTAGSFQIVDKHVIGSWPVRYELLKSLQ